MTDPAKNLVALRQRIRDSKDISEPDRELLLEFDRRLSLLDSRYGDHRREKLVRHCTIMAEQVGGLTDALIDREATERFVSWIKTKYDNEYTKHDYRTALRMFGEHVTDEEGKPETIAWVPSGTSKSHNRVPNPAEMLDWETDVLPMINESRNSRDAALFAVAFDAGVRSGELRDLTVGDVSDHRHGLQVFVDGKTGQRSVTLVPSVPYLRRWLTDHPDSDDRDAPLWSKLTEAKPLTYRRFIDCFKDAASRAGVEKPVTPTNFRKSNATYLARRGMNQAFIEDRQGRKRGSDSTAHYVAKFGGDADDQYAKLHGQEVETKEPEPIGPLDCPRCDKETPRHEDVCVWCGQSLDYDAVANIRAEQRELRDAVLRISQQNPSVLEDFRRARDLTTIFEDDPELYEDAKQFVQSLDG